MIWALLSLWVFCESFFVWMPLEARRKTKSDLGSRCLSGDEVSTKDSKGASACDLKVPEGDTNCLCLIGESTFLRDNLIQNPFLCSNLSGVFLGDLSSGQLKTPRTRSHMARGEIEREAAPHSGTL